MIIDIKELFDAPGTEIPLSIEVDLSETDIWGQKIFRSPVRISGVFKNRSGLVTLKYRATAVLEYNCDSCGKETSKEVEYEFEHWLARELESGEDNDDYVLVPTGMMDMDELIMTDVTLEIPFRLLCREDCKGLCPVCGSDLNEKTCNCNQKQIDPRLEKLKMLLDS
ncbi:MAG: DUF177 domain-containing protein [Oscillospiraceae bacterium]|nr:DUF177 domain-containing protein [Oscillospiraceae bacterium]